MGGFRAGESRLCLERSLKKRDGVRASIVEQGVGLAVFVEGNPQRLKYNHFVGGGKVTRERKMT